MWLANIPAVWLVASHVSDRSIAADERTGGRSTTLSPDTWAENLKFRAKKKWIRYVKQTEVLTLVTHVPFTCVTSVKKQTSVCFTYRTYPLWAFEFSTAHNGYSTTDVLRSGSAVHFSSPTPDTWAEKFESFERINSIRESNGNFDSCSWCKWLVQPFTSVAWVKIFVCFTIEFIWSQLSNFSVRVPWVPEEVSQLPGWADRPVQLPDPRRAGLVPPGGACQPRLTADIQTLSWGDERSAAANGLGGVWRSGIRVVFVFNRNWEGSLPMFTEHAY